MIEKSQRRETNLARLAEFLEDIRLYHITEETATIYGQIKAALFNKFAPKDQKKRRKTKIVDLVFDENDIWIAAVALQNNLTVVSSDSDFVRIQQARTFGLESWVYFLVFIYMINRVFTDLIAIIVLRNLFIMS